MEVFLQTFKQQVQNLQLDVTILKNGTVTVNGYPMQNPREKALANIILRLNGHTIIVDKILKMV